MNIVIPLAGEGKRFKEAGYLQPKPLIEVCGQTILEWSLGSLGPLAEDDSIVFIAHEDVAHAIIPIVKGYDNWSIVTVEGKQEGAATTVLEGIRTAAPNLDLSKDLLIMNGDQYFYPGVTHLINREADGTILLFRPADLHPKWSYVTLGFDGSIKRVAEKIVISDLATVGAYHFRRTRDFIYGAELMVEKDIRTNGEFYVTPVYNELIQIGKNIAPAFVTHMQGMGTPEDIVAMTQYRSSLGNGFHASKNSEIWYAESARS